ncbi:MAG: hypothetical protein ACYCZF_14635 [Anaerolineae bacterium]
MEISEPLDGWWHAFFEMAASWQSEWIAPTEPATHIPSVGWDNVDDHKESVRVPGIWRDVRPGYSGVVWYWRPFVVPAGWRGGMVSLSLGAICGQMEVYLDEVHIRTSGVLAPPFVFDLHYLVPDKRYTLILRIAHYDDSGGIYGPVTLNNTLSDALDI